jgi:hypothetical protein
MDKSDEDHIIFFDDKDPREKYEGETFRDKPHGKGILKYKDGTIEEGDFVHGVFQNKSQMKSRKKTPPPPPKNTFDEPQKSNLLRNIALGTAGLGVAGVAYYMMKKKRKSRSKTSSNSTSTQQSNRSRRQRSKRNRNSSSRFT